MLNLRPIVFWPSSLCLVGIIAISFIGSENFVAVVNGANAFITKNFGWLFSSTAVFMVGCCVYCMFSRIGSVTIGGKGAARELTPFKWFAVSLTTVIAMGIVFWPVAEAVTHFTSPPVHAGVAAGTPAALNNAMATMFVHWTVTPYAIYSLIAVTFALSLYNLKLPFSIATLLRPVLGKHAEGQIGEVIDFLGCFAVILGMSATLVSGIMAISDGFSDIGGISKGGFIYAVIAFGMMAIAIISAATGLANGIQWLARINTILYFIGLAFIFLWGPTSFVLNLGVESLGIYLDEFFARNLVQSAAHKDTWAGYWTVAWFASWFAWAPISCLFLGRIAKGYTVRQFMLCNFILPSVFGWFWFTIFGGTGMFFELDSQMMSTALKNTSFERLIYILFDQFPLSVLSKSLFIFVCAISYITAANANLVTIGGLCSKGVSSENPESALWLKIFWGSIIASIAWLGTTHMGLGAIRALFNMSGLPGLIIAIGAIASFFKVVPAVLGNAATETDEAQEEAMPLVPQQQLAEAQV